MGVTTPPVVVHIGFPKTGTTSLQRHFFFDHPNIHSMGKPTVSPAAHAVLECLTKPDVSETELKFAESRFADIHRPGRVTVLSHESLSQARYHRPEFGMPLSERIARVFGSAKVMIGTRSQVEWLESAYLHHLSPNSHKTISEFVQEQDRYDLDYYRLAMSYVSHLGQQNVGIFPLELLSRRPAEYMRRVAEFIGVVPREADLSPPHDNLRISRRYQLYSTWRAALPLPGLLRKSHRMVQLVEAFLLRGRRASVKIPAELRREIEQKVAPSNSALAAAFAIDLHSLGYPTEDSLPVAPARRCGTA